MEEASRPTPYELSALSPAVKALAQLLPELVLRDDMLQLRRTDEPTRFLTVVPYVMVDCVIKYYHMGPGASH